MSLKLSGKNICMSKVLDLTSRELLSIPEELLAQIDLEKLWIDDNQIETISEKISHLKNLTEISAYKNKLKTIPDWVFSLPTLKKNKF